MSQQTKQMYHPQECCFEPVPYGTPERADPQRSTMTPGCLVGCILLGLVHGYINRELDISSKFRDWILAPNSYSRNVKTHLPRVFVMLILNLT